jgi:hypothetical protein
MSFTPGPDTVGEIEPLSLWSGQGVALVRKVQPAAEIVREMNEEAKGILQRLGQHCSSQIVGVSTRFRLPDVAYWGTFRTWVPALMMSARGGKADLAVTNADFRK